MSEKHQEQIRASYLKSDTRCALYGAPEPVRSLWLQTSRSTRRRLLKLREGHVGCPAEMGIHRLAPN